ncbi:hypothetical protein B0H14DRAFT_2769299 [Mycena olivaceomarginata]|nr:hypothetical protein B0H14DRAFT_2769299 [Mycena olivaceomarginata]
MSSSNPRKRARGEGENVDPRPAKISQPKKTSTRGDAPTSAPSSGLSEKQQRARTAVHWQHTVNPLTGTIIDRQDTHLISTVPTILLRDNALLPEKGSCYVWHKITPFVLCATCTTYVPIAEWRKHPCSESRDAGISFVLKGQHSIRLCCCTEINGNGKDVGCFIKTNGRGRWLSSDDYTTHQRWRTTVPLQRSLWYESPDGRVTWCGGCGKLYNEAQWDSHSRRTVCGKGTLELGQPLKTKMERQAQTTTKDQTTTKETATKKDPATKEPATTETKKQQTATKHDMSIATTYHLTTRALKQKGHLRHWHFCGGCRQVWLPTTWRRHKDRPCAKGLPILDIDQLDSDATIIQKGASLDDVLKAREELAAQMNQENAPVTFKRGSIHDCGRCGNLFTPVEWAQHSRSNCGMRTKIKTASVRPPTKKSRLPPVDFLAQFIAPPTAP